MSRENVEWIERFWELYNRREIDAWVAMLAPDVEWHVDPQDPDTTVHRGPEAVKLLQDSIQDDPAFEMSYVTLTKIYLEANRPREATQVLERLLQRNPKHPIGLQILQQLKGGK